MNRPLVTGSVLGALVVTAVGAVAGYRMMDEKQFATVISVHATTRSVDVPRETCVDELVTVNLVREIQQKCRTVMDKRNEAAGYDVVYRLRDREKSIHLDYDPGRQIPMENGAPMLRP